MALTSAFPIEDVYKLGFQHWKAIVADWGSAEATIDERQLVIPYPIVGAQIAAQSPAGEAKIYFAQPFSSIAEQESIQQGEGPDAPTLAVPRPNLEENVLYIKRGKPYFWRTPAAVTIQPVSLYTGAVRAVFNYQNNLGEFGLTLRTSDSDRWTNTDLHLNVFFDDSPVVRTEPDYCYFAPAVENGIALANTNVYLIRWYPAAKWNKATFRFFLSRQIGAAFTDTAEFYLSYINTVDLQIVGRVYNDMYDQALVSTPVVLQDPSVFDAYAGPLITDSLTTTLPVNTEFVGVFARRQTTTGGTPVANCDVRFEV